MIALVFAAALAAGPAGEPAAASPPTAAAAPAAKPDKGAKPNKNGLVCKKEAVLGSRMPTRVCLTQAEWDQRKQDARDQVDQAQRNQPLNGN
jgi:hypothetical protein